MTSVLPTLYEYYTGGNITNGWSIDGRSFKLNGLDFSLYGGSINYFRVPREYWRDSLRKIKAAGLNTVEVYVPWSLHEPQIGVYDFGEGGSELQDFLDVRQFLNLIQEEDLFAIVRPGPYICNELEFGGLPSWLLRFPQLKLRSSEPTYMSFVKKYFSILLPILAAFQFTNGGPIIGFQVENEYGNFIAVGKPDRDYLEQLRDIYLQHGINELLFTSDLTIPTITRGSVPKYFLVTSNFNSFPLLQLWVLRILQWNRPLMVTEFWSGWYDKWGGNHQSVATRKYYRRLETLLSFPASVNIYMFRGGTSWGFLNGANVAWLSQDNFGYNPDTTSYDYDSPISENGDYTGKYFATRELLKKYNSIKLALPNPPKLRPRRAYSAITNSKQLLFAEFLPTISEKVFSKTLIPMEILPINNNSGQSYGYIVYRKDILSLPPKTKIRVGKRPSDIVIVLLNGIRISPEIRTSKDLNKFGSWKIYNGYLQLDNNYYITNATLELIAENWGRPSFFFRYNTRHFKGLWQAPIYINNKEEKNWEVVPLEFKKKWTNRLDGWHNPMCCSFQPTLYKFEFIVDETPQDTYIDMRSWTKGIVIVNGFVLGRYARMGPQQCIYLPAPLVKKGTNNIIVFEHYTPASNLSFSDNQIYESL